MSGTWEEGIKGGAIGCGVLFVGTVLLAVAGTISMIRPLRHALDDRTTLEQRFGPQDAYRPALDGAVAPDRLQAFLSVRRELAPLCREFEDTATAVRRLESLDDQEDVSRVDAIRQAWRVAGRTMGMGSRIGRLFEARNRALVDAGMGLGEYTYIYVMAYHQQLAHSAADTILFDEPAVNARVGAALRASLRHQLAELEAGGEPSGLIDGLKTEIERLDQDPGRLPWQDALPPAIGESFRAHRDTLDATFCPPVAELELRQNTLRGLATEIE
jgi:hypothetical protein